MLRINASEVAALIGRNRWKPVAEARAEVLRRHGFRAPDRRADIRAAADRVEAAAPVTETAVRAELEGRAAKAVGTRMEAADIRRYEQQRDRPVDAQQRWLRKVCCTPGGGHPFELAGYADAVTDDCVEEFKNRTRRLFGRVPDWEEPQLYTYMFLGDYPRGRLVESHAGESATHEVVFDPETWADMFDDLGESVDAIYAETHDPDPAVVGVD